MAAVIHHRVFLGTPRPARRPGPARAATIGLAAWAASLAVAAVAPAQDAPPPAAPAVQAAQQEDAEPPGRPWLGLVGDDMGRSAGVRIIELRTGGPADAAGLQVGDLITGAGGVELRTLEDMLGLMKQLRPNQRIEFDVVRDGRRRSLVLEVAERPAANDQAGPAAEQGRPYLGLRVIAPDDGEGALIERVEANSPAHLGGLRPGQRIVSLNGQPIQRPEDMGAMMAEVRPGQQLDFGIIADDQRRVATVLAGVAPLDGGEPRAVPSADPSLDPQTAAEELRDRIEFLEAEVARLKAELRRLEGDQ